VVGVPGRIVFREGRKEDEKVDLEHGQLPDPEAKAIACLFDQVRALENKVRELTEEQERLKSRSTNIAPEEKTSDATVDQSPVRRSGHGES
jgi:serine O-acetyltransferase